MPATPHNNTRLTHGDFLKIAVPFIVSTVTQPLLGAVDTAVIGHLGAAELIVMADKALYAAKAAGRNQVMVAGGMPVRVNRRGAKALQDRLAAA